MLSISGSMTDAHRRCDELFVLMEKMLLKQSWQEAKRLVEEFGHAINHPFSVEEDFLFPAIEASAGQVMGPVRMMTMEHAQMRQLIGQLTAAIDERQKDEALGICETLLITMQQHNMKEENILYPMADRMVPDLGVETAEPIVEHS